MPWKLVRSQPRLNKPSLAIALAISRIRGPPARKHTTLDDRMASLKLVDICIAKVAALLKQCYWPVGCYVTELSDYTNPFSCLPSHINEELISAVIQCIPSGTLTVRHLYLVLSSGRIRNFKLEEVLLPAEEFANILTSLSVHGLKLIKFVLREVYCVETPEERVQNMKSTAIELLLSMSPNLEHIEIDKEFDLKVLQHIRFLKHLELNFVPKNKLYDLIPRISDYIFIPSETITYISVFEDYRNQIPVEEVAFLLKYCPELTCIGNNIAGALEFLHSEELFCGLLTQRYKLQKYVLGSVFVGPSEGISTVPILHIAAVTCPCTKELDVLVNDHQAISVLADFCQLESLLIQWEKATAGDFRLALLPVIEVIGPQLKDLTILNFFNVDIQVIAKCCQSLLELRIEFDNEIDINDVDIVCFEQLTRLHVQCESIIGVKPETLQLLLRNCFDLTCLSLDNIRFLTDDLLNKILLKNPLSKLKEVSLAYCSLTAAGVEQLVRSCPSMEFLCFHSSLLTFDEAVEVVHNINPFIIVGTKV